MIKEAKKRRKWSGLDIAATVILTLLAVMIVIPFWNTIVVSFETAGGYAKEPFSWLPVEFTLENYKYLFKSGNSILSAYRSTILITVVGTLAGMGISTMAAYALSRSFPGKKMIFKLMIFTMFFNGGLVPTYLLIKNMNLIDTYAAVTLLGMVSVYYIIIMKNGFESVPVELQEAAAIDGANDLIIFGKIMLPLQKPLIATFSLFIAVDYWNSWYWPMLLINDGRKMTLQLYLRSIINAADRAQMGATAMSTASMFSIGIKMASVFAVALPIMMVYPFLQKYFVKGILLGAVKM